MSTTRLVPEQVLLLDHATLKTPLDSLRKLHKQSQKTYDYNLSPTSTFQRELDSLLATLSHAASSPEHSPDPATTQATLKSIDAMLARITQLKRKLALLATQSENVVKTIDSRVQHLAALPAALEDPTYPNWAQKRLSHQLVDYLLRADPPLKNTAKELAREEGIDDLVDAELWDEMAKVERGLNEHKLDDVLSWVGENRTALKKLKSPLEFALHLQSYIELCRTRDLLGAMAYARKHLSPAAVAEMNGANEDGTVAVEEGATSPMAELSRAMALLAYPPDTTCLVYQQLYSPTRWPSLRALFRQTFLTLHSLPPIPLLHMSLQAGLASLKTPVCCPVPSGSALAPPSATALTRPLRTMITAEGEIVLSSPASSSPVPTQTPSTPAPGGGGGGGGGGEHQPPVSAPPGIHTLEGSPSPHCPLCSSSLGKLGPEVPYSHHVNSTIVCPITGEVVEGAGAGGGERGGLVALVSRVGGEGRVYSREGLIQRASQHPEGKLVDPVTGEVFEWNEVKKVFIS